MVYMQLIHPVMSTLYAASYPGLLQTRRVSVQVEFFRPVVVMERVTRSMGLVTAPMDTVARIVTCVALDLAGLLHYHAMETVYVQLLQVHVSAMGQEQVMESGLRQRAMSASLGG